MDTQQASPDRTMKITLGFFVFLAIASLSFCGWLLFKSKVAPESKPKEPVLEIKTTDHPVTPEMAKQSAADSDRPAPSFAMKGGDGKSFSLETMTKGRPLVLVFIKTDCPCSVTAQPFFNELWQAHKKYVTFIGVINKNLFVANRWQKENKVPFPILADPNESLIRKYRAEYSAYSALVTPDGHLEKLWPGFSKEMLHKMNRRLSELTGQETPTLTFPDAPDEMYSGCPFEWPVKADEEKQNK